MSEEYLNKSGLAYFWSKLKAWCNSLFVTKATDETVTGQKTFLKFLIVKRNDYERGVSTTALDGRMLDFRDSHNENMGAVCCVVQADKSSSTCLYAYDTTVPSGINIGNISIGCDSSGNVRTHAPTPSASAPSDSIATIGWVNAASSVVHTTGDETIDGRKKFIAQVQAGSSPAATVEGGEILLEAPALGPQYNGIILDTRAGVFRIFGQPSEDGTTRTGAGTPFKVSPYDKIVDGTSYTYYVKGLLHKSTDYSRGVTVTEIWRDLYDLRDVNGTRFANFANVTRADKSSMTCIYAFDTTITDGANIGYIGIGCDANGNVVTSVPTPAYSSWDSNIVNTAWLRNLSRAGVYVSPSGNDNNDGMSSGTAVKTLARAIEVAQTYPRSGQWDYYIVMAAGSYSGAVNFTGVTAILLPQGNITISGNLNINDNAFVYIYNDTVSFTLTGNLSLYRQGYLRLATSSNTINGKIVCSGSYIYATTASTTTITASNNSVQIDSNSYCFFGTLSITTNTGFTLDVSNSSKLTAGAVTLTSTAGTNFILRSAHNSHIAIGDTLTINGSTSNYLINVNGNASIFTQTIVSNSVSNSGIFVVYKALMYVNGNLTSTNNNNNSIQVSSSSVFRCTGVLTLTHTGTNAAIVRVDGNSAFYNDNKLVLSSTHSNGINSFVDVTEAAFASVKSLDFSGKVISNGVIVSVARNANCRIIPATVAGNPTGRKYYVSYGGQLSVEGSGPFAIPGSEAGSVSAASYGYYS